jgi:TolB protein
LVGFFYWKNNHGVIGDIQPFPTSTKDLICFVKKEEGRRSNLFLIQADGTGLRQLTSDASAKRQPSFSPDGKQIVYVASTSSEGVTTFQVFLLGQGAPRQATTGSLAKDTPTFSPDGKRIAFLTGGAVKVMNVNATGLDQLFPPPHRGHAGGEGGEDEDHAAKLPPVREYHWSPLGSAIAGVVENEGDTAAATGQGNWWVKEKQNEPKADTPANILAPESIFVLPLESEKPEVVMSGNRTGFAWLPDGKSIVVAVTSRGGQNGLAILRVDEKGLPANGKFATEGNVATVEHPSISPDGKQLAFELWQIDKSDDRRLLGIAVISVEGGTPVIVRSADDVAKVKLIVKGAAHQPQWSPDGTRLLYWMDGLKSRDYYVSAADGTNPKKLLPEGIDGFDAVWSPAK